MLNLNAHGTEKKKTSIYWPIMVPTAGIDVVQATYALDFQESEALKISK